MKSISKVSHIYEWCEECNGTGDDQFMPVRECGDCEGTGRVKTKENHR